MEMEQSYGITVTNRFLIGDEDEIDDPEDFIKETTKTEKVKSPSQGKGKKQDSGSNKKKQEIDTKSRKEEPKDSRTDSKRGGRGRNNNVANSRPPRKGREGGGGKRQEYTESVEDQENQAPNDLRNDRNERPPRSFGGGRSLRDRDGDRPPRSFGDRFGERPARDGEYGDRPPRGRGGRGRGGRGRGGPGGREFRGKREFDRHSGSDKSSFKPQDKREGGGNHNWGNFKDDVKEANTENTANTFTAEEWDAGESHDVKTVPDKVEGEEGGTKEGETPEDEAEKEPDVQEMTLDEYKALQASARPKQEFKLRQAGEGENKAQWKKTYLLKKTPPTTDMDADKELDQEEHSKGEHGKSKDKVDITVHFYDQPTRGGRGGRRGMGGGRGRGRGGRGGGGGGRGGRSRSDEPHISLTDHNQFPSLDGN